MSTVLRVNSISHSGKTAKEMLAMAIRLTMLLSTLHFEEPTDSAVCKDACNLIAMVTQTVLGWRFNQYSENDLRRRTAKDRVCVKLGQMNVLYVG